MGESEPHQPTQADPSLGELPQDAARGPGRAEAILITVIVLAVMAIALILILSNVFRAAPG